MQIRAAQERDINQIIALMKSSLGESMIPKSEKLWRWKHEENPFGKSYVLVAEEDGILIGLRAFMQWQWRWNGKIYRTIRAVDTATHPDHQGKGIFKKLTLKQLELCKEDGVHFVFNTPNEQSRPGYLKMGWVQQGKMPLKIKLQRPFSLVYSRLFDKQKYAGELEDPTPKMNWNKNLFTLLDEKIKGSQHLSTPISADYIRWRYTDNPLFNYNYFFDNETYLLICRIKNHASFKELRLAEFVLLNPDGKNISAKIKTEVNRFCSANKIDFISMSGRQYLQYKPYFTWMGIFPVKQIGPIVTLKEINMGEKFNDLQNVENWAFSLGDMELF